MFSRSLQFTGSFIRSIVNNPLRRARFALLLLGMLVLTGTAGYILLERMQVGEALYMTVITITTVGFGEVKPLDDAGRIFTIGLILLGFFVYSMAISSAIETLLGDRLWQSIDRRRLKEQLMQIHDHYIVCGYGRIGRQIVRDLRLRDQPFVVIEHKNTQENTFVEEGIPYIIGDATQDEVQQEAGIERASGFVAALDSDAENVLAVLTARVLNPRLFIVARAASPASEVKLRRAGANRVVSPYDIGGHRISLALLRPAVHDLLNQIFDASNITAEVGQLAITSESRLAGQTIGHCDLRKMRNVTILAVQKENGTFQINPDAAWLIQPGETLIVIGPPEAIYQLENEHEYRH